jgi:hypothetical protein
MGFISSKVVVEALVCFTSTKKRKVRMEHIYVKIACIYIKAGLPESVSYLNIRPEFIIELNFLRYDIL